MRKRKKYKPKKETQKEKSMRIAYQRINTLVSETMEKLEDKKWKP